MKLRFLHLSRRSPTVPNVNFTILHQKHVVLVQTRTGPFMASRQHTWIKECEVTDSGTRHMKRRQHRNQLDTRYQTSPCSAETVSPAHEHQGQSCFEHSEGIRAGSNNHDTNSDITPARAPFTISQQKKTSQTRPYHGETDFFSLN